MISIIKKKEREVKKKMKERTKQSVKQEKQGNLTRLKDNAKLRQRNNESGITLIALVVTIIVLLILARSCDKLNNRK